MYSIFIFLKKFTKIEDQTMQKILSLCFYYYKNKRNLNLTQTNFIKIIKITKTHQYKIIRFLKSPYNNMSQQQNRSSETDSAKFNKTKQQRAKQKDNTSAWQKKQQEKKIKKQKQANQAQKPAQLDQKALEKAKIKQQKRLAREQMLKEQELAKTATGDAMKQVKQAQIQAKQAKHQTKQTKVNTLIQELSQVQQQKRQVQKQQKNTTSVQINMTKNLKKPVSSAKKQQESLSRPVSKLSKQVPPSQALTQNVVFSQLLTLYQHISRSSPLNLPNKVAQSQLLYKYLDQYITPNDTILILSNDDKWTPNQRQNFKRVYLHPQHEEFNKSQHQQNIVCTYGDIAYLMEGTLTKIFVQLDVVFGNGTGLTQKGNQNIITLANEFKIPVIGYTGTWNFNAWNFLSLDVFLNKYGQSWIQKYDVLESQCFQILVLQIGSVIPKQISGHLDSLSKIYRGCDLASIKW